VHVPGDVVKVKVLKSSITAGTDILPGGSEHLDKKAMATGTVLINVGPLIDFAVYEYIMGAKFLNTKPIAFTVIYKIPIIIIMFVKVPYGQMHAL